VERLKEILRPSVAALQFSDDVDLMTYLWEINEIPSDVVIGPVCGHCEEPVSAWAESEFLEK
jgi:hypothetical protein